jgi:hypothetical protein
MAWRLHLTNQAIQYLDILDGEPPVLAAWSRRDRVLFYDLDNGTQIDDRILHPAGEGDHLGADWQTFLSGLRAPNGAFLPLIRLPNHAIHLTDDGRLRLYHQGGNVLLLETDGKEVPLDAGDATNFVSIALDRLLGLSAALDETGKLHLFQQHIRVGAFDLGLKRQPGLRSQVAISRGGSSVYVTNGREIVLTDTSGEIIKRHETFYDIRQMSCSPGGRYLMTNDLDTGVIRVYEGSDLTPTHQRFAVDLVAEATQIQLMADLPPTSVAPSTLACNDAGGIAFSMSGVICVSDLSFMDDLPRPQTLL